VYGINTLSHNNPFVRACVSVSVSVSVMTDGWGQYQEMEALRLENAQLKVQLREIEYGKMGENDIVSTEKALEVVGFIQSELPDLDEAVFHVTDVLVHELWTFESTTSGRERETIRGLGATVLSKRQHEEVLRGGCVCIL
jgi:hypothetical protein